MSDSGEYIAIDSYANIKRLPVDVAVEDVKSGKVEGKQIEGKWYVSEKEVAGDKSESPGIVTLLYVSSVSVLVLASIVSISFWPTGYRIPFDAYIFPCSIVVSGILSALTLAAMAKGLSLLHSISVSVRGNA